MRRSPLSEAPVSIIEICFVILALCASIATYSLVEAANYWLAKQRKRDKKEAEIQEQGFE